MTKKSVVFSIKKHTGGYTTKTLDSVTEEEISTYYSNVVRQGNKVIGIREL